MITIVVVSTRHTAALARLSVRCALAADPSVEVRVLDIDGGYSTVGREMRVVPRDLGLEVADLHRRAAAHGPELLSRQLQPVLVRALLTEDRVEAGTDPSADAGQTVLALRAGVLLLHRPTALLDAAAATGLGVHARVQRGRPADGRGPGAVEAAALGGFAPELVALHQPPADLLGLWEDSLADDAGVQDRWLDLVTSGWEHRIVRDPAALLSGWNLTPSHTVTLPSGGQPADLELDGQPVVALDLSAFDAAHPWLLDATATYDPRARLSDHPALAALVSRLADDLRTDSCSREPREQGGSGSEVDFTMTSLGIPVDAAVRAAYSTAVRAGSGPAALPPDPFDPEQADLLRVWLTEAMPDGGPGRYLAAIRDVRPDLQQAFPDVPGRSTPAFLAWAQAHGRADGYAGALIDLTVRAASPGRPAPHGKSPHGVNVVGFLRGELGIGESARLMVSALESANVPHATVAVDRHLASRQGATHQDVVAPLFDTSLICVNADLTASVAATIPDVLERSYRIGMWYWEVEAFPEQQLGAFASVDEVWVATDFVRHAIEPHSPVPVRTVTPPLPQRGPEPTLTRTDLGLPDRPVFLFSFDFLSTAERKNPIGLINAFTQAFRPGEGPVLVIKSINAHLRPSEAEHLRLAAAGLDDVMLLEEYLSAEERDALVALCDCYVSLHRSEGLGLTMAEAMAWGKPVIATGYSGNLQFMTEQNSFLVPWVPASIGPDASPYPAGATWADPDIVEAASLMRLVIDDPAEAAARGARAALDIATLHSPAVAGRAIVAGLAETAARRRARSRLTVAARLRDTARAARRSLG